MEKEKREMAELFFFSSLKAALKEFLEAGTSLICRFILIWGEKKRETEMHKGQDFTFHVHVRITVTACAISTFTAQLTVVLHDARSALA